MIMSNTAETQEFPAVADIYDGLQSGKHESDYDLREISTEALKAGARLANYALAAGYQQGDMDKVMKAARTSDFLLNEVGLRAEHPGRANGVPTVATPHEPLYK
jgi:hypothetical protein